MIRLNHQLCRISYEITITGDSAIEKCIETDSLTAMLGFTRIDSDLKFIGIDSDRAM